MYEMSTTLVYDSAFKISVSYILSRFCKFIANFLLGTDAVEYVPGYIKQFQEDGSQFILFIK